MTVQISIIADYDPDYELHAMTHAAIEQTSRFLDLDVAVAWKHSRELSSSSVRDQLQRSHGIFVAPGSPYQNMNGVLETIYLARKQGIPFLGTCGGFQHAIIEYVRNELGIEDAEHGEYDAYASRLIIHRLACSLVGRTMTLQIVPGTLAGSIYNRDEVLETYHCNFGVNPEYVASLKSGDLIVSGSDQEGEIRIVELPTTRHPYFLATLFVPQSSSTLEQPHPVIKAFVLAAHDYAMRTSR